MKKVILTRCLKCYVVQLVAQLFKNNLGWSLSDYPIVMTERVGLEPSVDRHLLYIRQT